MFVIAWKILLVIAAFVIAVHYLAESLKAAKEAYHLSVPVEQAQQEHSSEVIWNKNFRAARRAPLKASPSRRLRRP